MSELIRGFLQDAGLLLALVVLFDVTVAGKRRIGVVSQLLMGVVTGSIAILLLSFPVQLSPGVVFDSRSVLTGLTGLFLGPVPTLITVVMGGSWRLGMGGAGVWAGVATFAVTASIGLIWRARLSTSLAELSFRHLLAFGLVVHLGMIASMLLLPAEIRSEVVLSIAVPVLVVLPLATAAVGWLLARRLDRVRLSDQLEESEDRYRSLFENNHAVMLLLNPESGKIEDANGAAASFYGWSRDELLSMRIGEINTLPPEELRERMALVMAGERSLFRFHHRKADGGTVPVEVKTGTVTVGERRLLYSIVHDISTEVAAERELRLKSAALEAAPSAMVITGRDGVIRWVNQAFIELYGYSSDEALGKTPGALLSSGRHDTRFYEQMWGELVSKGEWRGQITNRKRDGTELDEELAITSLRDDEGEITHFIAVKQDLTRWQEIERRLAMAQRMEAVGKLAGGIAHDFNNLLTVINGSMELILDDLPTDHPMRPELVEVREAGMRAGRLTRQLLAFSRRQILQRESVDLNSLVSEMMKMLRRLIGEDVEIRSEMADGLPPVLNDPSQLEQVVVNLALNARDAMPSGGVLTIQTAIEELQEGSINLRDGMTPGPYVRLSVVDTGTGIDPAILPHILEPFFTTKKMGQGTGLGLSTVFGIVSQSRGQLRIDSKVGMGSRFDVLLPAHQGATTEAPRDHASPSEPRTGTECILLVEDEPAIRNVGAKILKRAGYTVVTAATGEEAIALLEAREVKVDLLFTDVVMPGMSGVELVDRVRAIRPDLGVLFASGYTSETLLRHGIEEGEHRFIGKPYSVDALTRAVREALNEPG